MKTRQELLDDIKDCKENADPGCCMCGSPVDHSAWAYGHTPVSMYDYYVSKAEEALKEYDEANAA
jgi:hypothetical protein